MISTITHNRSIHSRGLRLTIEDDKTGEVLVTIGVYPDRTQLMRVRNRLESLISCETGPFTESAQRERNQKLYAEVKKDG